MAGFRKDKTTAAQTAANVAGQVTSALVAQGSLDNGADAAAEAVVHIFNELFAVMGPVVDADNALFAEVEAATPAPAPKASGGSKGSSSRGRKTGGGKGGDITLEDALNLELTGRGVFAGETLRDVLSLSTEQCDSDYGYGDGEKDGRDYIAYLATERNKNGYTRERARIIADAEGINYDW
jgi:hypothetical protein